MKVEQKTISSVRTFRDCLAISTWISVVSAPPLPSRLCLSAGALCWQVHYIHVAYPHTLCRIAAFLHNIGQSGGKHFSYHDLQLLSQLCSGRFYASWTVIQCLQPSLLRHFIRRIITWVNCVGSARPSLSF